MKPTSPRPNSIYYFFALNTNGDSYYGYSYADTGTYYEGQYFHASVYDNDGGYWAYYVYDSYDYGYESIYEGYSYGYDYYDQDGGGGYLSSTSYSNTGGIGSEYGYTSDGQAWGFYGYYEVDKAPSDSIYYFFALNTNGDSYYGYSYADTGTYYEGQTIYASVYDNDGSYWSYYVYDSYDYGYESIYDGYSYGYDYYDQDGGGGYLSSTSYSNTGGIGSEYGYTSDGEAWGFYGNYEADAPRLTRSTISTLSTPVVTAITATAMPIPEPTMKARLSMPHAYDNDGGSWSYYVYNSYDYGYDSIYEGYSYGYDYYDHDVWTGHVRSTSYAGYEGIGSEYGYTSWNDPWGMNGRYEADYPFVPKF